MAFFVFGKAIALIRVAKGKIAITRLKLQVAKLIGAKHGCSGYIDHPEV
jgi:hypothetical protein